MLKLHTISKTFSRDNHIQTQAIKDISLQIREGEFVAIVGPSGCGKTTLLRILAGLVEPSQGNLELDGNPITGPGKERGMVFQDFTLFPWLTVEQNIAFGLKIKKTPSQKAAEIVRRYLVITGLIQFKDAYPTSLSGGMKQRVAIARTLANNPQVLLLDEPFGALDVQTRTQMQEFLARIWETERKTTIMITHDVDEALFLADRIIILSTKPGTIKEDFTINFPRPRRSEVRYSEEFTRLKKYITYAIRSESIKAATDLKSIPVQKDKLIIGGNIWPGLAPFYLAKEKGLFEKYKLPADIFTIEWSEDRLKPWKDGNIDLLYTTLDIAMIAASQIPDLKIIMPLDVSWGGDVIAAHAPISKLHELKGKHVAYEKNWVSEFFLYYMLDKAGMSSQDVFLKNMRASDIGSAIINQKVDAGSIQEPWYSKTQEFAQTNILADSKECPILFSVLITRQHIWEEKKEAIKNLQTIWAQSIEMLQQNPTEAIELICPYLGMAEIELSEQLDELKFIPPTTDLLPAMKEIQTILLKEKLICIPLDLESLMAK